MKKIRLFVIVLSACALMVNAALGSVMAMSLDQVSGQMESLTGPGQSASIQIRGQTPLSEPACKTSGDADYSSSLCERKLGDGTLVRSESHSETAWNEVKKQTVVTLLDAGGREIDKQAIRRKAEYRKGISHRIAKESLDIVRYPKDGKITRTVIIFTYDRSGKRVVKMNDARYVQIKKTDFAELIQDAALTYDKGGLPLRGHVELWKNGKKSKELFRWDRDQSSLETLDRQAWKQWENKAKRASMAEALFG